MAFLPPILCRLLYHDICVFVSRLKRTLSEKNALIDEFATIQQQFVSSKRKCTEFERRLREVEQQRGKEKRMRELEKEREKGKFRQERLEKENLRQQLEKAKLRQQQLEKEKEKENAKPEQQDDVSAKGEMNGIVQEHANIDVSSRHAA